MDDNSVAHSGYTILELLIYLSILIIISSLAIPSFIAYLKKIEADSVTHQVRTLLNFSRQTAINRANRLYVCGLNKNNRCDANNIRAFVVYLNDDRDTDFSAEEDILVNRLDLNTKMSIDFRMAFGRSNLYFKNDGSAGATASIILCGDRQHPYHRRITMNIAGRIYIQKAEGSPPILTRPSSDEHECLEN